MRKERNFHHPQRPHDTAVLFAKALVIMVAMASVACTGDVRIGPTQPAWPGAGDFDNNLGPRILDISGQLIAEDGTCFEATILFDGRELEGARRICANRKGCARLRLEAEVESKAGRHTVAFKVLSQSAQTVEYAVQGRVLISRQGLFNLNGAPIVQNVPLVEPGAELREGDSISFELDLRD